MRLLDLCCGAGGAGMGYHLAGWEVVGVDVVPQPDYPFEFVLADGLEYLKSCAALYDAIHASPPCQASSTLSKGSGWVDRHVDLVGVYRRALAALPQPTVVENVRSAQLRPDLMLCGTMFGLRVLRHRYFEVSFPIERLPHPPHQGRVDGWRHGRIVKGSYLGPWGHGGYKSSAREWGEAMGIDWMTKRASYAQAIPPAYTRYLGEAMMRA